MIIFQTAGGGHTAGLTVGSGVLDSKFAPVTTFRNNAYIHQLNRTLQAEMRVLSAYRSLSDLKQLDQNVESHQSAGRELVRLVIANRGIPEDRSALSFGVTRTLIHICASIPARFFERMTLGGLLSLERQLVSAYRKLVNEAPLRDVPVLEDLMRRTETHAAALQQVER